MDASELKQRCLSLKTYSGELDKIWKYYRPNIVKHIKEEDPENLLNWSTIQATMFIGNAPYVKEKLTILQNHKDWVRWEMLLQDPMFGNPSKYEYMFTTSGNFIVQVSHLAYWEIAAKKQISEPDCIFEYGGGYGAMAYIARKAGFKGKYILFDFPEMLLLQEYYLSNTCGIDNVEFVSDVNQLASLPPIDLFIALFSFSETPIDIRKRFMDDLNIGGYLVAYQGFFDPYDNNAYFADVRKKYKGWWWSEDTIIPHLNCHYLAGGKK